MQDVIAVILKRLTKGVYLHAGHVCFSILMPLLQELGWAVERPDEVDHDGSGSRLLLRNPKDGSLQMILETRDPRTLERQSQPEQRETAPFHLLTDGGTWRFFHTLSGTPTPIKSLDIRTQEPKATVAALRMVMSREAILGGTLKARLENRQSQRSNKKEEILRKALAHARPLTEKAPFPSMERAMRHVLKRLGVTLSQEELTHFLAQQEMAEGDSDSVSRSKEKQVTEVSEEKVWVEPVTEMEFLWVPPGRFQMGSPQGETGRQPDEGPVHEVSLDGFWMSRYPVTQKMWRSVMLRQGRAAESTQQEAEETEDPRQSFKDKLPVEHVLWEETQQFIEKLKLFGGRGSRLRLPTEAEWEYVARAGSSARFPFDERAGEKLGNYAWYTGNSDGTLHPVGSKSPNAWGFHDLLGGVWEWVDDLYGLYQAESVHNPTGPAAETIRGEQLRIRRGGSYRSTAKTCRPARRNHVKVDEQEAGNSGGLGFRLVRIEE
ncbi:MAG: formylglycine-generating enzyme family protein [Magnetococcales bacterium]|nr:formylglycine-generating enzyme family protein [Magnetococcales bacterium]